MSSSMWEDSNCCGTITRLLRGRECIVTHGKAGRPLQRTRRSWGREGSERVSPTSQMPIEGLSHAVLFYSLGETSISLDHSVTENLFSADPSLEE